MISIDKSIIDISKTIDNNIEKLSEDVGLLSQNILNNLRNFVEAVISKIYVNDNRLGNLDLSYERTITPGIKFLKGKHQYKHIIDFHNSLQISVSHYTLDENGSERLIHKYLEKLIKIRLLLKDKFGLHVLNNLDRFPLYKDSDLFEYYLAIQKKIILPKPGSRDTEFDDRYYIHKKKPIFINGSIYYEVSVVEATDRYSKFDRFVFYTQIDMNSYYAIKVKIRKETVTSKGLSIPVIIVTDYQVAIRPCEIDNYAKIVGITAKTNTSNKDYYNLSEFLKKTNFSLVNIVDFDDIDFDLFKDQINNNAKSQTIVNILIKSRRIIVKQLSGSNMLKLLLLNLHNLTIKNQYNRSANINLSSLYLNNGCLPFEQMPYCSSPIKTNVALSDLFEIIVPKGREHELLARFIKNKTEIEGQIYSKIEGIDEFDDIPRLIDVYNSKLYNNYNHQLRRIEVYKGNVFIKSYDSSVSFIISELIKLSKSGIENYTNSVISWLSENDYKIDSDEKNESLRNAFNISRVFIIYGAAGTGKTKMLEHFSNFFHKQKKVFLSNTYASLENMKRRIKTDKSSFLTVKKYLNSLDKTCDVLVLDECSTISNEDMDQVLKTSQFKVLILSGDPHQIESISFGNWFEIAKSFVPETSFIELKKPYRTENPQLIELWDKVRNHDANISEYLIKGNFCHPINNSILDTYSENEIILCLNYDGLYGINNVNRILQQRNINNTYTIGTNDYKINDPILFNENSTKYEPLLYNNAKGIIRKITNDNGSYIFNIEIDKAINELDLVSGVTIAGKSRTNNSIIQISIGEKDSTDNDNAESNIPFNVSYAVSIHKSQGLEYESVKIIIVDEIDEMITNNIFYTAVTRTRNSLKIFWSANTQQKILSSFAKQNNNKDINIISVKHNFEMVTK